MSPTIVKSLHNPFPFLIRSTKEDEWELALSFAIRFVTYITLMVVIMVVISLIMKFMNCDDEPNTGLVPSSETNRLMPKETTSLTYGTYDEEDLETGNWSSSSSEDLYDARICVICYDNLRDCFFIPCGHYATCYACAQRIFCGEENKNCPICRQLIHKVRKVFTS